MRHPAHSRIGRWLRIGCGRDRVLALAVTVAIALPTGASQEPVPTRSVVDHATADSGPPAAVGTTDNKGQVNLRAGKKFKFKFKFVDDYGEPIPNLIVALVSEDKRWGVVLVNDPLDRFPPKMVILTCPHG